MTNLQYVQVLYVDTGKPRLSICRSPDKLCMARIGGRNPRDTCSCGCDQPETGLLGSTWHQKRWAGIHMTCHLQQTRHVMQNYEITIIKLNQRSTCINYSTDMYGEHHLYIYLCTLLILLQSSPGRKLTSDYPDGTGFLLGKFIVLNVAFLYLVTET